MTQIEAHAVVLSHNSISHLTEADFRPGAKVKAIAAVWNFFSPEKKKLGSEQPAERANFTPDVSRCDITDGLEESTAHFHTLTKLVIARTHPLKQNKMFYLFVNVAGI